MLNKKKNTSVRHFVMFLKKNDVKLWKSFLDNGLIDVTDRVNDTHNSIAYIVTKICVYKFRSTFEITEYWTLFKPSSK